MSSKNNIAVLGFQDIVRAAGETGQWTSLEEMEPRLLLSTTPTPLVLMPGSWQSPTITLPPGDPGTSLNQENFPTAIGWDGTTSTSSTTADTTETGTRFRVFDQFGGTWSDAEKQLPDSYSTPGTGDDFMCWAGAASNALEWTGWGNVIASGISNADQIFKYLQDHWTDQGSLPGTAWEYWFDGTDATASWGSDWSHIDVSGGGDFYSGVSFQSAYHSRGQGSTAQSYAMKDIDQYLRDGDGVTLGLFGPGGHAITCWGFNYDSTQTVGTPAYYKGIWVTDSDDNKNTNDATTAPNVLHYYGVQYNNGKYYLQDFYGTTGSWYIGEVDGLSRESSTPVTPPVTPPTPVVDDYANAGDYTHAAPITLDSTGAGTISGIIETGTDTDLFKFVAAGTGTATITLTSSTTLDGVITAYDANGNQLAVKDLYWEGQTETLTLSVTQDATYYVMASSYHTASTGSYAFAIQSPLPTPPPATDDYANAGDYAHAAPVALDSTGAGSISGVVEVGTDTDLFQFVAAGTGAATITLTPSTTLDGVITVFDASGNQLATRDRYWEGQAETLTLDVTQDVTYYVMTSAYQTATTGSYSLAVHSPLPTPPPAPDDYANAGDYAHAAPITLSSTGAGTISGVVEVGTDTDLFQFVAAGTGRATVKLTPSGTLDGVVTIFDANGTQIAMQDRYYAGGAETVSFNVTLGATYFVQTSAYQSVSTGTYSISIQSPLPPPTDDYPNVPNWSAATAISIDATTGKGSIAGAIEIGTDTDLFQIVAPRTGNINITLTPSSHLDAVLTVYASDGTVIRSRDYYWAGRAENLTLSLTAGLTYYIEASSYRGSTGTYTLSVQVPLSTTV